MTTIEPHIQLITIPGFGRCTMIPFSTLPQHLRSYEKMRETAKTMGLEEFPELLHHHIQEITKCVALHIRGSGSVLISGVVEAYPVIAPNVIDLQPVKCVASVELISYDLPGIEAYICYVPITSLRRLGPNEIVLSLFRGGD